MNDRTAFSIAVPKVFRAPANKPTPQVRLTNAFLFIKDSSSYRDALIFIAATIVYVATTHVALLSANVKLNMLIKAT